LFVNSVSSSATSCRGRGNDFERFKKRCKLAREHGKLVTREEFYRRNTRDAYEFKKAKGDVEPG
jgi:hypothetical protein